MARPVYHTIRMLLMLILPLIGVHASFPTPSLNLGAPAPLPACPVPTTPWSTEESTEAPLWTLSDWSTDFTLPDGGAVIFRLLNNLTGYDALCFRRGEYPEGYCVSGVTGGGAGEGEGEEDTTGTLFTYYEKIGLLEVYQEWSCVDAVSGTAGRAQADGRVIVNTGKCSLGEEMKGEMCGAQGGGGKIYATRVQVSDEVVG